MDLARAFPGFDPDRIVFREDGLLVVDKPAGVSSQSADPEVSDDLPARLRGLTEYLGTHQRLDAETSGLVVFTTEREANAVIAEQLEKRLAKKTYIACVTGWRHRGELVMRDAIDGKNAVTRARAIERREDRALLEIDLETGRTHQARIHLSRAGSPVAGDALYGGAPAPRLMLHAAGLEIRSPRGRTLRLRAPLPPEMRAWIEAPDRNVFTDDAALHGALARAFERRWGLLRAMPEARTTTVMRLAHEDGDALPGLAIDYYAGHAVAIFSGDAALAERDRIVSAIASFGFDSVIPKLRPKHSGGPRESAPHASAPPLVVHEEGAPFFVRLDEGLATGLYADQRKNRRRVRAASSGKRVLNLFSYTCAFSVVAALGGATRTVSVDASAVSLERGRENMIGAGIDPNAHDFVVMDAAAYLERTARKGETFDLVILDPPSFGTSGKKTFSIASDLTKLCALAMSVLSPRGEMLASINHRKTSQSQFRHAVARAAESAKRSLKPRDIAPPLDFPAAIGGEPHLKAVWVSQV